MTKGEELFHKIAAELSAGESKMFGALCIKAPNGKAACMFKDECMIFKLGSAEEDVLKLKGAKVFDPMGGRPMNGWIQLSYEHAGKWSEFAGIALDHVKSIEVVKKTKKK
jgi:hypothetical protein